MSYFVDRMTYSVEVFFVYLFICLFIFKFPPPDRRNITQGSVVCLFSFLS